MADLKRIIYTVLLLIGFTTLLAAQTNNVSNGRVPVTKQRTRIHHHIKTAAQKAPPGYMAFGWSSMSGNIVSMPLPAGTPITALNLWYPPNGDFAASAVRGGDGNYYIVCIGPPSSLWQMDPVTGATTKIGSITGLRNETVNGITYNPVNHTYYLAAGEYYVTNNLYSFDVHTLTATLIGSFPDTAGTMIDIAINSSGVGYGYDLNDSAYTFDPVTGITTTLGPLGFDCNYGQGMDIDQATGTIYLSAFNDTTFSGQLRTMNPTTGATTLLLDWGSEQIAPFAINNEYVIPGPGTAANPSPAKGATNVDINGQLSWINAAGALSIKVMFGTSPSSMSSIYAGAPVTTINPGEMSFFTQYYWRVDETDASGTTYGTLWNFKTASGPNVLLNDSFDNLDNWTVAGPLGLDNWYISNSNFAGGTEQPELQFNWYPDFTGASYILSDSITAITGHNYELTFTNSVAELWDVGPIIGVAVTTNGGSTFTSLFERAPNGAYGPVVETIDFVGKAGMQLAFYFSGNSYNFSTWAIDDAMLTDLNYVNTFPLSVNVIDGWNMVSIPGNMPTNNNVDTWWANRNPMASVYKWSGSYTAVTTAAQTEGYWMLHNGALTYNTGDEWPAGIQEVHNDPLPVAQGWNMIGAYNQNVPVSGLTTTPPDIIVPGTVYGWNGVYFTPTDLVAGYGYWVLTNAAGAINVVAKSNGSLAKEDNKENWGKINITDASGKTFTLYSVNGKVDLNRYQLPPVPPEGCFDVRYSSQRKAEDLKDGKTIEMRGMQYPVTIVSEKTNIKVQDETGKIVNKRIKTGESLTISDKNVSKLSVSESIVPDVYSLSQNYPNPFNPGTLINFTLPEDVKNVTLIIYDALGQKVSELVNGSMEAGFYQYQWNASSIASGLYIYQLRTEKFVSTRKMMLLK